jgi:hypothetical protein
MNNQQIVEQAIKQAMAPPAVPPLGAVQQGVPAQLVLHMVQMKVLTPKQAWYWLFKQIEPTEFYEQAEGETK